MALPFEQDDQVMEMPSCGIPNCRCTQKPPEMSGDDWFLQGLEEMSEGLSAEAETE